MLAAYEPNSYGFDAENRLQTPEPMGATGGGYGRPMRQPQQTFGTSAWDALQQPRQQSQQYFDDPLSQPIMQSWTRRMNQLRTPGPDYGEIEGMYARALRPDPRFDDALASMKSSMNRSAPGNSYLGYYADTTKKRVKELNEEPFDASAEAALKARFFDDLARSRDDRSQQLRERLARNGMAPTSGTAQEASALLEGEYEGARARTQRELLEYVTNERNRRRDLGVQMSGGLSQQGQADANNQAQFEGQRASIAGNMAQLLAALQQNRLGVAGNIASMRRQSYLDNLDRGGLELETSALPAAMQQQRMAQMQQALSSGGMSPEQIAQLQQQQQQAEWARQQQSQQNKFNYFNTAAQIATPIISSFFKKD